jgi:hypothetical protein
MKAPFPLFEGKGKRAPDEGWGETKIIPQAWEERESRGLSSSGNCIGREGD